MSDRVEVYRDDAGEWRWRRFAGNGELVSESGEGYANKSHAVTQAVKLNDEPDMVVTIEGTND